MVTCGSFIAPVLPFLRCRFLAVLRGVCREFASVVDELPRFQQVKYAHAGLALIERPRLDHCSQMLGFTFQGSRRYLRNAEFTDILARYGETELIRKKYVGLIEISIFLNHGHILKSPKWEATTNLAVQCLRENRSPYTTNQPIQVEQRKAMLLLMSAGRFDLIHWNGLSTLETEFGLCLTLINGEFSSHSLLDCPISNFKGKAIGVFCVAVLMRNERIVQEWFKKFNIYPEAQTRLRGRVLC